MAENLLSAEKISAHIPNRILFENLNFGLHEGEKIGLIGPNGGGKTTLLSIMAGVRPCDDGRISRRTGTRSGYLPQNPQAPKDTSLKDYMVGSDIPVLNPLLDLIRSYRQALEHPEKGEELGRLTEEMELQGAWELETQMNQLLDLMGLRDQEILVDTLSGGMLRKAALARALADSQSLLFLDEPTNHLDLGTITWLEEKLISRKGALVVVTHDRYFLERVCDQIWELEEGELFRYSGSYNQYLSKKEARLSQGELGQKKLAALLKKEESWLHRQPKARGTKDKKRVERVFEIQGEIKGPQVKMASFESQNRRLGKEILKVKGLTYSWGTTPVIKGWDWEFNSFDRLGVVGPNGVGKTTLLRLLIGDLAPDLGSVLPGQNTFFGYFDQTARDLQGTVGVLEYLKEQAEFIKKNKGKVIEPGSLLESFLFPKSQFQTPVNKLSGGERRRLMWIRLLMSAPNFLVLDEPTNDFDIQTLRLMEDYLESFEGLVIVVSHDRYFLDRVADHFLILQGDGSVDYQPGPLTALMDQGFLPLSLSGPQVFEAEVKNFSEPVSSFKVKDQEKKKLSFKEEKEFASLMGEIEKLEEEKKELELFFSSGEKLGEDQGRKSERYENLLSLIEKKTERWEFLSQWL